MWYYTIFIYPYHIISYHTCIMSYHIYLYNHTIYRSWTCMHVYTDTRLEALPKVGKYTVDVAAFEALSLSLVWMEIIGYVCMIWYDFIRLYCTSLYILYLYCRMTSTCSCFVWVWMFSIWFYWIIVHEYTCRWMRTDADAWDTHILCMLRK